MMGLHLFKKKKKRGLATERISSFPKSIAVQCFQVSPQQSLYWQGLLNIAMDSEKEKKMGSFLTVSILL